MFKKDSLHAVLSAKLVLLALGMFAFGYVVMPPLYRVICASCECV